MITYHGKMKNLIECADSINLQEKLYFKFKKKIKNIQDPELKEILELQSKIYETQIKNLKFYFNLNEDENNETNNQELYSSDDEIILEEYNPNEENNNLNINKNINIENEDEEDVNVEDVNDVDVEEDDEDEDVEDVDVEEDDEDVEDVDVGDEEDVDVEDVDVGDVDVNVEDVDVGDVDVNIEDVDVEDIDVNVEDVEDNEKNDDENVEDKIRIELESLTVKELKKKCKEHKSKYYKDTKKTINNLLSKLI